MVASFLDSNQLANIRTQAKRLFGATCDIERVSVTSGADGITPSTSNPATGVACAIQPTSGREQEIAQRLGVVAEYTVYLPDAQDVTARDRIVSGGRTYEVTAVLTRQGQEVTRKCFTTLKDSP